MSFAVIAATIVFILMVVCGNWQRVGGGEILSLLVPILLLAAALAGTVGRASVKMWWIDWTANLLALAFCAYGAFFFHIF